MNSLAERVKKLRTDLNMSQRDLSNAIKLHRREIPGGQEISGGQGLIHAIESGRTKHPTCIWELSKSLETTVDYLVTGKISTKSCDEDLIREIDRLTKSNNDLRQALKNFL